LKLYPEKSSRLSVDTVSRVGSPAPKQNENGGVTSKAPQSTSSCQVSSSRSILDAYTVQFVGLVKIRRDFISLDFVEANLVLLIYLFN
jgi:hypothetical protein